MYHDDGIAVHLIHKRKAADGSDRRFEEIEEHDETEGGMILRCAIVADPSKEHEFEVVVRITQDFDPHSAKALQIGIGKGSCTADDIVVRKDAGVLDLQRTHVSSVFYALYTRSGINGRHQLVSPEAMKFGLVIPKQADMSRAKGDKYWYKNNEYDQEVEPNTFMVTVQRGNVDWKQKALDKVPHPPNPVTSQYYERGTFRHLRGNNGDKYIFMFRVQSGASQDNGAPRATPAPARRAPRRRQRKTLQVCDCPDVQCRPREPKAPRSGQGAGLGGSDDDGQAGTARKKKRPTAKAVQDVHPGEEENFLNKESLPSTCRRCKKVKKAPKGKKITWRARANGWMVVHRDAEEEEPPMEEVEEEGDEMPDPNIDSGGSALDERTSRAEAESSSEHADDASRMVRSDGASNGVDEQDVSVGERTTPPLAYASVDPKDQTYEEHHVGYYEQTDTPPGHQEATQQSAELTRQDQCDLGIKPEIERAYPLLPGLKRSASPHAAPTPTKAPRLSPDLDVKTEVKKKEEIEEPRVLPVVMSAIGTEEEPITLSSDEEDEYPRGIAEAERAVRRAVADRKRLLRQRNLERLMRTGGSAVEID